MAIKKSSAEGIYMLKMNKWLLCFVLLQIVLLVLVSGCDRNGDNIPINPPTASVLLDEAWQHFQAEEYDDAVTAFTAAKDRDALQAEAFLGLGWTLAKQLDFDSAISNFRILQSITESEALLLDSYAGLTVCYSAQGNDDETIENGLLVLDKSASYAFSKDNYIDAKMMGVVVARSYVNNEDYLAALEIVDSTIESGFLSSLISDGTVVKVDNMEVEPITSGTTLVSGEATLRIEKDKAGSLVAAELVKVLEITDNSETVNYSIVSFEQGGRDIIIKGNPIPKAGDIFKADILYAENFGNFLSKLYTQIETIKN
jgi:tetratricopeptide (TPR) repeat protein